MSDVAAEASNEVPGSRKGRFGQDLSRVLGEGRKSERVRILVEHVRWLVGEEGFPWISELARVGKSERLTVAEIRNVTSDIAWISREAGEAIPERDLRPDDDIDKDVFGLVLVYVRGQRLRFDFRFRELFHCAEEWRREYDDALICAFGAFAACGLRLPDALSIYKRSIEMDDVDKVSRHVSLTAIWMAQQVPNQAALLLELADRMITLGEGNAVLYFRRARAYSRLGDYERALDDIYQAMDLVGPDNNLVHADYVREWQIIVTKMDFEETAKRLVGEVVEETAKEAISRIQEAERALSDGQLRMVEILGLFMALVGFLVAGGSTFLQTASWQQAVTNVVLIGLGSISFFMVLRWIIHFRRS
ncbi:hypothetical protein AB0F17_23540 [Nonomuraea sp. NPDC026600]|uniref:hypothetical protein n=1 Tax=Nonomuraea sp. NPDC026600 TaxID=3155363 RepID=UPI0033FDDDE7